MQSLKLSTFFHHPFKRAEELPELPFEVAKLVRFSEKNIAELKETTRFYLRISGKGDNL